MVCVVSEGDSPLKITWLKDGRPLNSTETTTHHIGEYDLTLMIQSATTANNGNYTCVASNDAAETSRTASLLVHGTQGTRARFFHPHLNSRTSTLDPTTFPLIYRSRAITPLLSPWNAARRCWLMITVIAVFFIFLPFLFFPCVTLHHRWRSIVEV